MAGFDDVGMGELTELRKEGAQIEVVSNGEK